MLTIKSFNITTMLPQRTNKNIIEVMISTLISIMFNKNEPPTKYDKARILLTNVLNKNWTMKKPCKLLIFNIKNINFGLKTWFINVHLKAFCIL